MYGNLLAPVLKEDFTAGSWASSTASQCAAREQGCYGAGDAAVLAAWQVRAGISYRLNADWRLCHIDCNSGTTLRCQVAGSSSTTNTTTSVIAAWRCTLLHLTHWCEGGMMCPGRATCRSCQTHGRGIPRPSCRHASMLHIKNEAT